MNYGQHWTGYPPDDPPEGEHWCSRCEAWDEDCECEEPEAAGANGETTETARITVE